MIFLSFFKSILFFLDFFLIHFLSYIGAFDANASTGISPSILLLNFKVRLFVLVVFPITAKSKYGDISEWETSAVTSMEELFYDEEKFNEDISQWNASNVTNMRSMFNQASSFNQDISQWNVSNVINMSCMFSFASSFNQDIGKWPIKADCNTDGMFYGCLIEKQTFEGKLYGHKIAEYFNLDDENEDMVWEPYTRWERRKYAVMLFSSLSKMNVDEVDDDETVTDSIKSLREIDDNVYRNIVTFI